jgi:hypothetical protein
MQVQYKTAGRITDDVFPMPSGLGSSNPGVSNYPNTKMLVSISTTFLKNAQYTETLPTPLVVPTIRGSVAQWPLPGTI